MMNYIWSGMILISLTVSLFTGKLSETVGAAMSGATDGVQFSISLLGIMCLWTGLAKIGERAGLIDIFSKILRPITKILFPRLEKGSPALNAIVMNMVANLLGMGNAATPDATYKRIC